MSSELIIAIIIAITVIMVMLWQGMSIAKTDKAMEQTEQYRKLAEQATSAEQRAAEEQEKIAIALEDMRARLAAIEKLLADVQ
ncbi:MAG TPA: hypothetical protein VJ785_03760 [Anaerolineales bacterium]|nr:hypothetical protein [Anaerolineales bacterium]